MVQLPSRLNAILLALLALVCLHPAVSSALGLVLGLFFGVVFAHPNLELNKRWIHRLLAWSIIGIGAGMNLGVLAQVGLGGIAYTLTGIALTMGFGLLFGRLLGTPFDLSILICSGTAICGGSAIAAVSSTLRSRSTDVSTALVIVFLLNSIALMIFPPLGHALGLDQDQFGLWSALAIHDTSSVVGASMRYGTEALQVGTTVKLARALWIIPLTLCIGALRRPGRDESGTRLPIKKPWFILGFLAAAAVVTWIPSLAEPGQWVAAAAKRLFVLTLFLIGTGFNRANLSSLSLRPLLQAVLLWILVAGCSLGAISWGWARVQL